MSFIWDQLPEETHDQYAHFLRYRNLGPQRSHKKAYAKYLQDTDGFEVAAGKRRSLHVPGSWYEWSVKFEWPKRAAGWDVRNLQTYGSRLAVLHVQTVAIIASKNKRAAKTITGPGAQGWRDLMESCRVVAEFLTPEVMQGVHRGSESTREIALPAGLARAGASDDGNGI